MKVAEEGGRKENENAKDRKRRGVGTARGPGTARPSGSCPERTAVVQYRTSVAPHHPGNPGFKAAGREERVER